MDTPRMILHQHPFVKAVAAALRQRCGVCAKPNQTARVLVAVSGGPDSVAILRVLAALAQRRRWPLQLAVAHVQHHLRNDAETDAAFVAKLAQQLKLPHFRADLNLKKQPGNLEANARRARYQALASLAQAFNAHYVATGHHSDDQLETLLMRLLRGASVRGLSGMAWKRRLLPHTPYKLIRPLLAVDRNAVLQFLTNLDQPWRQDHTNTDPSRLRAALRRDVLPRLRNAHPHASQKAVTLADHLRHTHLAIERQTDQAQTHVTHKGPTASLSRNAARHLPAAVLQALLRRLIINAGANHDRLGAKTLQAIARAATDQKGNQRSFNLTNNAQLEITRNHVRITRNPKTPPTQAAAAAGEQSESAVQTPKTAYRVPHLDPLQADKV